MKLNLYVLRDELPEYDWQGELKGNAYDEMFCGAVIYDGEALSDEEVTLAESQHLEQADPGENCCILCIGKPREKFLKEGHTLYTEKQTDLFTLMNQVSRILRKYQTWEMKLQKLVDQRSPYRELAIATAPLMCNCYYAQGEDFHALLSYIPPMQNPTKLYQEYSRTMIVNENEQVSIEAIQTMLADVEYAEAEKSKVPTVTKGISYGFRTLYYNLWVKDTLIARITLDEIIEPFRDKDLLIIQTLGEYLKKAMLANPLKDYNQPYQQEKILGGLLSHTLLPEPEIQAFLARYEWQMHEEYICLISKLKMKVPDINALSPLGILLQRTIKQCCFIVWQGQLVCAVNLSKIGISRRQLLERLKPWLRDNLLVACVSSNFHDFKNLYYYYQMAHEIQMLQEKIEPTRWFFNADNYRMEYLLKRYSSGTITETLIPEGLKKLMQHDREKGSHDVELLQIYLDNERSVADTVRLAFMHRNSFQYRLERIKEISGLDLDDARVRILLQLAFRLPGFRESES